jgi:macrolide-specific efflux system membrane fusion protein
MSPEERQLALAQSRARGVDPTATAGRGGRGAAPADAPTATAGKTAAADKPTATTFDALFAPLPPVESVGRVWLHKDNQLTPVRVRTGVVDGQNTELLNGELEEGAEVVTNVVVGSAARPAAAAGGFPGLGQPQRGGFPGGGGNRGGGGGGGNRGGGR